MIVGIGGIVDHICLNSICIIYRGVVVVVTVW